MHHERLDGSGYPLKIKDKDISTYAKIIMIADAYDAMTTQRVYHSKVSWQEAMKELHREQDKYEVKYLEALYEIICKESGSELKSG